MMLTPLLSGRLRDLRSSLAPYPCMPRRPRISCPDSERHDGLWAAGQIAPKPDTTVTGFVTASREPLCHKGEPPLQRLKVSQK